ncbi:hypothetical protein H2198_004029 [Neophaeococcomyces mojaviensis]|uniref:Uncharacterized protein n=1 Tax=Neophaeococcomyces mojaviensis TaxID=3383035 RepID=A0ACC3AAA6_9EURO|nr:hypothetical protein H2198_004029 [Knufia sp. JES_112]
MSTYNILITGTKAGIGHGLLSAFASRPNTTIIAAIRDAPDSDKAKAMIAAVPTIAENTHIIPVQYDASTKSAHEVVASLATAQPKVTHLDLVIANAAVATQWGPTYSVTAEELTTHLNVNTIAPILLYQATRDLLLASPNTPKFILISTVIGSIEMTPTIPFQTVVYGLTKAAGNYFTRKANSEEDKIVIVSVHPGWVQTDMGNRAASKLGMDAAPLSMEESVKGLVEIFDKADKTMGGTFQQVGGEPLPW